MEESGRGAAVEQLTARGMLSIPAMGDNSRRRKKRMTLNEYQSPQWGAIAEEDKMKSEWRVSIPAMGGNRRRQAK